MSGIFWLIIGLIIGTLFGVFIFKWLFTNFFDGIDVVKGLFSLGALMIR